MTTKGWMAMTMVTMACGAATCAGWRTYELVTIPLDMGDVNSDARHAIGTCYFAVRCDYRDAAGAARLHATTSVAARP